MKNMITHDTASKRFEIVVDGYKAYVEYNVCNNTFDIIHTIVPQEIGGRGIARLLVETAYRYATDCGYHRKASCSYAAAWLKKNE